MVSLLLELIGKYSFVLTVPILISFFFTYFTTHFWINLSRKLGLLGKDMHKIKETKVAESGGIWVALGITFGLLVYIFLKTYIFYTTTHLLEILSIIVIVLLSAFLGFIDDLLGWKKGLKPWQKPLFTIPIAIPLMVLRFGHPIINLPFLGSVNLGVFYPLLLVPIAIVGAANGFNMLAGYNGLEASLGILLFLALTLKFLEIEEYWLVYICLIIIFSILAFLIFNKYPAKVFPGDSFTLSIGSVFATLVILGNIEKFGLSIFTLYILELLLFLRGLKDGIYKENFAKVDSKGFLHEPYPKIYSMTHFAVRAVKKIKGRCRERDVVMFLIILQIFVILVSLWMF